MGEMGVLEYGSIGVLGFKSITPLFHHSNTPVFQSRCSEAIECNEAYEAFSATC